jgi:hypothetical protein
MKKPGHLCMEEFCPKCQSRKVKAERRSFGLEMVVMLHCLDCHHEWPLGWHACLCR